MRTRRILTIVYVSSLALAATAQNEPYRNPDIPFAERAWDLLKRMTPDEKISQMKNGAAAVERLGIPQYDWWNEALHGVGRAGLATVFPQAIGLAATFDEQAVYETFDMVSDEARAKYNDFRQKGDHARYKGLTFWTPNVNIFRDPRWGRGQETYGEDPYLTTRMGLAVVRGLQGDGTQKYDKTHACAKHYAVHSGPEGTRHSFDTKNIALRDLHETYLPAFKALVTEGKVKEVMCAYNRFEGEPCCSNKELLIRILREEWNYDGIVVSDCGAISDFYRPKPNNHGTHASAAEASADAVLSGTDLNCGSSYSSLKEAMEKGIVSESKIDESVFRLLRARFQLGMFDDPTTVSWSNIPYSVVNSAEHQAKALEMARKSMTLLTNRNRTLPLSKALKKIALVGPNANDSVMMWGNYNGTPAHTVTILEGIRQKLPSAEIVYEKGCDYVEEKETDYKTVAGRVADADVILFAGGISPTLEGEEMSVNLPGFKKGDRTSINLPQVQKKMLEALKQTGKPVVLILCTGSAIALPEEAEHMDAILNAWYPGQAGGTAVADVLFGDYNPAGRLPVTFYASDNDLPDFEDYSMANRTYRYFKGTPLFPFGHGLSYTTFEYGNATLETAEIEAGKELTLTIPLQNTGSRGGDEVVQIYVRQMSDSEGPAKSLRAFRRVSVKAGESATIQMRLPANTFEFYNPETKTMTTRPGQYELLYGGTSDSSKLKRVTITLS